MHAIRFQLATAQKPATSRPGITALGNLLLPLLVAPLPGRPVRAT